MVRQKLVGERLRLALEGWGPVGSTVAQHNGKQVLVLGGIPGEEVVAEVVKDRGEQLSVQVVEVLIPSPHRVSSPCPYYGPCTGCQWQHIDYQHQLDTKKQIVLDALEHVGGFGELPVLPTLASPDRYGYRNHARFTVGRKWGELGFVNRESRRFVTVQSCLLMHPGSTRLSNSSRGSRARPPSFLFGMASTRGFPAPARIQERGCPVALGPKAL